MIKKHRDEADYSNACTLTIQDVDKILHDLPKDELMAYRESLEFYRERLLFKELEYSINMKQNSLTFSSIKVEHKSYNRRG